MYLICPSRRVRRRKADLLDEIARVKLDLKEAIKIASGSKRKRGRRGIEEGKDRTVHPVQLSELSGTDKHIPKTEYQKTIIEEYKQGKKKEIRV